MAQIHCHLFSETLGANTDINVIVPSPNSDEMFAPPSAKTYFREGARFQTLYLFHGAFGDYADWQRYTSIERYAQERKLLVFCP